MNTKFQQHRWTVFYASLTLPHNLRQIKDTLESVYCTYLWEVCGNIRRRQCREEFSLFILRIFVAFAFVCLFLTMSTHFSFNNKIKEAKEKKVR